jgi:hypothetical protein
MLGSTQTSAYGICGGRNDIGTGFSPYTFVSTVSTLTLMIHTHSLTYDRLYVILAICSVG